MPSRQGQDTRPVIFQSYDIDDLADVYRQLRVALREIRSAQPDVCPGERAGEALLIMSMAALSRLLNPSGWGVDVAADIVNATPCPGYEAVEANIDVLCKHCQRLRPQHFERVIPLSQAIALKNELITTYRRIADITIDNKEVNESLARVDELGKL